MKDQDLLMNDSGKFFHWLPVEEEVHLNQISGLITSILVIKAMDNRKTNSQKCHPVYPETQSDMSIQISKHNLNLTYLQSFSNVS